MLYIILLLLKIGLFINITNVKYNTFWVFLISALFILTIYSIIYFSKKKRKDLTGLVVYLVLSLIILIDIMHYSYFNRLPTVKMLSQAGQVTAVTDSLKEIFTFKNMLAILDLPLVIFYTVWKIKKDKASKFTKEKKYSKKIRYGLPSFMALICLLSILGLDKAGKLDSVSNQEIFSYHMKDIKMAIKKEDVSQAVDQYEMQDIIKEMKERARLKDGKHTGIAKGKNLIVLQVESLQDFVINDKYEGQEITPNINKLIKDQGSLYFDNYYQSIASGNTSDGEFTSNNALHPSIGEPSYTEYQDKTFYGLPWLLRDNGYKAWSFHGFEKSFWNREKAYPNQGFERFISEEDYKIKEKLGFGLTDKDFFDQSMPYLKEMSKDGQEPFYAFMITLTSHHPYKMPEKYHKIKLKDKHKDTLVGNYLQAVHYTDEAIGDFIEELKKEGLYDNTVIALYGDHFGISSLAEDNKKIMTDYLGKDYDLDEMMKIPLVIHVPGENINETISEIGCQLDFYPTIQNLMGYDNPKGLVFGRDLLNRGEVDYISQQSYSLRGSFMKDDIFFQMSRDGVFENSKVINKDTHKLLNPEDFRDIYERVIAEVNTCDYILKHDLIKDLLEGKSLDKAVKREVELLPEEIREVDSKIEEMDKAVSQGVRGLRMKLKFEKDSKKCYSNDIDFEQMAQWMRENPDVYILFYFDPGEVLAASQHISYYYKDLTDKIIMDIDQLEAYQPVLKYGYKMIYHIDKENIGKSALEDVYKNYPDLNYISTSLENVDKNKPTIDMSKDKGKQVFVRTQGQENIRDLRKKNIRGIIREK